MKSLPRMSFLCALAAVTLPMQAAESDGFYAGLGTGRVDFDFDDASFRSSTGAIVSGKSLDLDADSGIPLRLSAGYNMGSWAIEAAYERLVTSVDLDAGNARINSFDYSNFTAGVVYRSAGTLYFIGKFGLSMPDIEAKAPGTRLKMGNSAYYGAGFGYRMTPTWSAEFDYSQTNDDTGTFMLNLRRHF